MPLTTVSARGALGSSIRDVAASAFGTLAMDAFLESPLAGSVR
jgi:hypothetical protein